MHFLFFMKCHLSSFVLYPPQSLLRARSCIDGEVGSKHLWRSRGSKSGRNDVNWAEIAAAKAFKKSGESPWETSLSRPFPNGSVNAGS